MGYLADTVMLMADSNVIAVKPIAIVFLNDFIKIFLSFLVIILIFFKSKQFLVKHLTNHEYSPILV